MAEHYLKRLPHIKALVFDVDGVLTDGSILLTPDGGLLRSFNTKDSYALKQAGKAGLHLAAITRGDSTIVQERLTAFGFATVRSGILDKLSAYGAWKNDFGFQDEDVLYMGDDIPDLPVLQLAGVSCCPQDAVHEVREACAYISPWDGGRGSVRDVVEKVLRAQQKWRA